MTDNFHTDFKIAKTQHNTTSSLSNTKSTQVLRKSTIQTSFRTLHKIESGRFALKQPRLSPAKYTNGDLSTHIANGNLIDPTHITRGKLLETEIILEAESIFQMSTVMHSMLEILEEHPNALALVKQDDITQVRAIEKILTKLMAGLIPIRGESTIYSIVIIDEKEWIIHNDLAETAPQSIKSTQRPLFIVGITEHKLFWRDIRRILFSKTKVKALCRVSQTGLLKEWTPVKMTHILEKVFPELAEQLNSFGTNIFQKIKDTEQNSEQNEPYSQFGAALRIYANRIAQHCKIEFTQTQNDNIGDLISKHSHSFKTIEERRSTFDMITLSISGDENKIDPYLKCEYRTESLAQSGFSTSPKNAKSRPRHTRPQDQSQHHRFIDTEFIAIYW